MATPTPRLINKFGTLTGWNQISVPLFGRELEGFDSIKYGDKVDIAPAYGAGRYPIGMTEGNYEAEAEISLYLEESIGLVRSLPKGMRFQDIPAFDIPVVYDYHGTVYKDVIRNCRFTNTGRESKNGEGKITMVYTLVPSHIDYNV